ncbi:hypothetical protein Lal_00013270 [Lupinus albus]|uniref:Putative ribosomal protein L7/L12 n=1 Tax=Lupinus albus TaxID=3870 RepID=A0A6A5P063_LUPAL|nr:putative ribosomal protein L7/L12 [Lupinus albus]KAF1890675.1 hypothetical protein Lal_00013270 [Lupinus albus]
MFHLIPKPKLRSFQNLLQLANRSFSTETRTQKLDRIADDLISLNRFERHDFSILWSLKLGLNRYTSPNAAGFAPAGASAAETGAPAAAEAKEKTVFDIKLEKYDASAKIKIIKEVRSFTDLGLKEAKDLVEKVPCVLKKGLTKEDADSILEKLKALGATVALE